MNTEHIVQKIYQCFLNADRETPVILFDDYAKKFSYERAIKDLLDPALNVFGIEWMRRGDISLAQGYVAGKIAEDLLNKAADELTHSSENKILKGSIVIGNIEDDYHSLGRRLVATFLKAYGWDVYDLGNDVPPEEFVDKALEVKARVIGASAMMYANAINIKKLRDEIDKRNLTGKIQLAVGGAIFILRPELIEAVGGDGTAPNAISAVEVFESLYKKALEAGDL